MKTLSGPIYLLSMLLLCGQLAGQAYGQEASKPSNEAVSVEQARKIVTRTYERVLKRPPDHSGLDHYVKFIVEEGRDEAWLRDVLKGSPEYAERVKHRKQDRINFSVIAVIVLIVGGILFFPRKKAPVPPDSGQDT